MIVYNSRSVDQTQYLARKLSETINVGSVVMLIGNLGTGKTTFVQGLAMIKRKYLEEGSYFYSDIFGKIIINKSVGSIFL